MYLLNNRYSISGLDMPLLKLRTKILLTHTREHIDWKRDLLSDVCMCSETRVSPEHLSTVCIWDECLRSLQQSGEEFLERGFFSTFIISTLRLSSLQDPLWVLYIFPFENVHPAFPKVFLFRFFRWLGVSEQHILCYSSCAITRAAAYPVSAVSSASQILCFSLLFFKGSLKFRCLDMVAKAGFRNIA